MMCVDASAAIGIAHRKGLGKIRHLHTKSLWVPDAVREKRVLLDKVPGADNPADMYTKHLDAQTLLKHMKKTGMEARGGRSQVAPALVRSADKHEDIVINEQVDLLEIDVEFGENIEFDKGAAAEGRIPPRAPWWRVGYCASVRTV